MPNSNSSGHRRKANLPSIEYELKEAEIMDDLHQIQMKVRFFSFFFPPVLMNPLSLTVFFFFFSFPSFSAEARALKDARKKGHLFNEKQKNLKINFCS